MDKDCVEAELPLMDFLSPIAPPPHRLFSSSQNSRNTEPLARTWKKHKARGLMALRKVGKAFKDNADKKKKKKKNDSNTSNKITKMVLFPVMVNFNETWEGDL